MSEVSHTTLQQLVRQAREALAHAHAPYSHFPVAAAVLDNRGRIHVGVNVENVSFGLTCCAERVAIFSAVAHGAQRIHALAVTSAKLRPIAPCGACRQVIHEFCDADAPVVSEREDGQLTVTTAAELLPGAFSGLT